MNEIEKFDFHGYHVRVVSIDNEPWWVLSDVAKILGYKNTQDAKNHLTVTQTDVANPYITRDLGVPGGKHPVLVTESGLYQLVMRSRQAHAKPFQAWVTGEVLPTIRKTGGAYVAPGSKAAEDFLDDPIEAMQRTLDIARQLRSERDQAVAQVEAQKPAVESFDVLMSSVGLEDVGQLGKTLGIGRNTLFAELRNLKVLDRFNNPYQVHVTAGRFVVRNTVANGRMFTKTLVTPKGVDYVRKLLVERAW